MVRKKYPRREILDDTGEIWQRKIGKYEFYVLYLIFSLDKREKCLFYRKRRVNGWIEIHLGLFDWASGMLMEFMLNPPVISVTSTCYIFFFF